MVGLKKICAVLDGSRGFPTDLPMVGPRGLWQWPGICRGFPTDLPMVGHGAAHRRVRIGRGFPTDLPMVGR
jgi:hypothetical protein